MYQSGTFKGYVQDYGIGETKAGDPQVFIVFGVNFPDGEKNMTWYGSLKEGKGREITIKALLAVGFEGNDVTRLIDGTNQAAPLPIAPGAEASLVIEEEERQDGNGKIHKIKWVNRLGGGGNVKRADPVAAKAKLAALNISGDIAKARALQPSISNDPGF
jgi:hypothetical protein